MGHLNSFSASGGGSLNKNFPKIQMPGGLPGRGMLKLRFSDWYIIHTNHILCTNQINLHRLLHVISSCSSQETASGFVPIA